ncbi:MAG: phosphatase PAP2 family protein [Chloroflexi bacterium]|nr:phosphatase PAP2 family protein [Chloroflexota bacterium]
MAQPLSFRAGFARNLLFEFALLSTSVLAFLFLTWWAAGKQYLPGEEQWLAAIIAARQPVLTLPAQLLSALGSMNVLLPLWVIVVAALALKRQVMALLTFLPIPLGYPLDAALKTLVGRAAPAPAQYPWIHDLSFGYYLEGLARRQVQQLPPQGVSVPAVSQPVTAQAVTQVIATGFPSGHALLAMLFYATVAYWLWKSGPAGFWRIAGTALVASLAFLPGIARVYMGVHFPSDVLGAWLLAPAFLIVAYRLARWVERRWVPSKHQLSFPCATARER